MPVKQEAIIKERKRERKRKKEKTKDCSFKAKLQMSRRRHSNFCPGDVASQTCPRHVATCLEDILARHLSSLLAKMSRHGDMSRHVSMSLVCFYVHKPIVLKLLSSYTQETF